MKNKEIESLEQLIDAEQYELAAQLVKTISNEDINNLTTSEMISIFSGTTPTKDYYVCKSNSAFRFEIIDSKIVHMKIQHSGWRQIGEIVFVLVGDKTREFRTISKICLND